MRFFCLFLLTCTTVLLSETIAPPSEIAGEAAAKPGNEKLQKMYELFYLPFSVGFETGNDKIPFVPVLQTSSGEAPRLLRPEEFSSLENDYGNIREDLKKKSLLLKTEIPPNKRTVKISNHLYVHKLPLKALPLDQVPIPEQIQITELLKSRNPAVGAQFTQLRFLKSYVEETAEPRTHLFLVAPSWCKSSEEFGVILESVLKTFPQRDLVFHYMVINDPEEQVFDSPLIKAMFPKLKPDDDRFPKFLALEPFQTSYQVLEEAEALDMLLRKHVGSRKGYLNGEISLFKRTPVEGPKFRTSDRY